MTLRTKGIYEPIDPSDGKRISVMSRHTEDDGKEPDARIIEGVTFHEWEKKLGPPLKLIGAYYRGGCVWEPFEDGYLAHLRSDEISLQVKKFAKRSLEEDLTFLCKEPTPEHCHRRLLAEECKRYEPNLELVIR